MESDGKVRRVPPLFALCDTMAGAFREKALVVMIVCCGVDARFLTLVPQRFFSAYSNLTEGAKHFHHPEVKT